MDRPTDKHRPAGQSTPPFRPADREGMLLETKLLIACFVVLVTAFVWAVMKVLGAWADHHISRHDLIVESKRRRLEYFNSIAERQAAIQAADEEGQDHSSIIIEEPDEAPALAA